MVSNQRKLRIAWFSDLSTETGLERMSAYFSTLLLPYLKQHFEIELFAPKQKSFLDMPVADPLTAYHRHEENVFDAFIYQVEDRLGWSRIFPALLPGIVIYHDLHFTSHGPEPILNSSWEDTIKKFKNPSYPFPERGREFEQQAPLGYREAGAALIPLFTQRKHVTDYLNSVNLCLREKEAAPSSMYLPVPIPSVARAKAGRLKIYFSGTPRIEHRAQFLLPALSKLSNLELVWLLDPSEVAAAQELIREFGIKRCQLIEGRTAETWKNLVQQGGLAVHTAFTVFGHLSPYLEISLAAGLPVIVTNFGVTAGLPEQIIFTVEQGAGEEQQIFALLKRYETGALPDLAENARAYAEEVHAAPAVATELARLIVAAQPYLSQQYQRWNALEKEARTAIKTELQALDPVELLDPVFKEFSW